MTKQKESYFPYFMILFSIIAILMIVFYYRRKTDHIIYEKFMNQGEDGIVSSNVNLTSSFQISYINGQWTTSETTLDANQKPTNLMTITLNKTLADSSGTILGDIVLPNVPGNAYYNGSTYNITLCNNMSMSAINTEQNMSIYLNFINIQDNPNYNSNSLNTSTMLPMAEMSLIDNPTNKQLLNILIYKVPQGQIAGQLASILKNKNYSNQEYKPLFSIDTYLTIINHYQFPQNFAKMIFGREPLNSADIQAYNLLKNSYGGHIILSIAREFNTPQGTSIKTRNSPRLSLNVIEGNQLPNTIQIENMSDELEMNLMKDDHGFSPKATYIYFYKLTQSKVSYQFEKPNMTISNALLSPMNKNQNIYKNNIQSSHIESVQEVNQGTYTMTLFKTVMNPSNKAMIQIPFSDIYNIL